jgi:chromosome partitioning protein
MGASIITVFNQKGGAGKTTLTMQLAGTLARRKHKVLVVDADSQGTATRWAASAPQDKIFPAAVNGLSAARAMVHREVRKFVDDYRFIIIDCPPALESEVPESALLISDITLVPIKALPAELWASVAIRRLIERQQGINDALQARIVISDLEERTRLARSIMERLEEFGIPLMKTRMHHRIAYPESMIMGCTVHDLGVSAKPAIEEMDALTDEVLEVLKQRA